MKLFLRNLFVSLLSVWALVALTGCETLDAGGNAQAGDHSSITNQPAETTRIRIGEQLTIELMDITPPSKIEQAVADDGTITLPLLAERVKAAGKEDTDLSNVIHDLYVPRYYKRLTVNIKRENRYFFVRGEVKNPSQRVYTGDMTAMRAIGSAGDFTTYADKKRILVIRSNGHKEKFDANKALKNPEKYDLKIFPGDTVYVPLSVW
jgi:protein involved in polysaccharide export with SLBB domain